MLESVCTMLERIDKIHLKFKILAIRECYFTLKSGGDEKTLHSRKL